MDLSKFIQNEIEAVQEYDRVLAKVQEIWTSELPTIAATFDRVTHRGDLIVHVKTAAGRWRAGHAMRTGLDKKLIAAGDGEIRAVRIIP